MTGIIINRDREKAEIEEAARKVRFKMMGAKIEDGQLHRRTTEQTKHHSDFAALCRDYLDDYKAKNPDAMPHLTHLPYKVLKFIEYNLEQQNYIAGLNVPYDEYNDMVTAIVLMFFPKFVVDQSAIPKVYVPDSIRNQFDTAMTKV